MRQNKDMTWQERVDESIRLQWVMSEIAKEAAKRFHDFMGLKIIGGFEFSAPGSGTNTKRNEIPDVDYLLFLKKGRNSHKIKRFIDSSLASKGFKPCPFELPSHFIFRYFYPSLLKNDLKTLRKFPDRPKWFNVVEDSIADNIINLFTGPIFGTREGLEKIRTRSLKILNKYREQMEKITRRIDYNEKLRRNKAIRKWRKTMVMNKPWINKYNELTARQPKLSVTIQREMARLRRK